METKKVHPEDADKCAWDKLDGEDWWGLLLEQTQFASLCACWDEMKDDRVRDLIRKRPELKSYFPKSRLRKAKDSCRCDDSRDRDFEKVLCLDH